MIKVVFNPGSALKNKRICRAVAAEAERQLNQTARLQIDVNFISAEEIRDLNKIFRLTDAVTDTLSFPFLTLKPGEIVDGGDYAYAKNPFNKCVMLGEVFINLSKVEEQAEEFEHAFERELAYLTAHSILHLFGYLHNEPAEDKIMTEQTESIVSAAGFTRGGEADEL